MNSKGMKKGLFVRFNNIVLMLLSLVVLCGVTTAQIQPKMVMPVGHTGYVFSAEISPNEKYLVTASMDLTVRVWNLKSGKEIHQLLGHKAYVSSAVFSNDGQWILTGSGAIYQKIRN